jgi:Lrp/AsnC family transcriptional regulator, regulator for asnA, asnC and gidA
MKTIVSKEIEKIDVEVLELLIQNNNNKKISSKLDIPLSTIQRRIRNLIEKGFVIPDYRINYEKFGIKTGLLHIYLNNGNLEDIMNKVSKIEGITSIELHIGNSDILAGVIYNQGSDLLEIIAKIKKFEGVERIMWSERILEYPISLKIALKL